MFEVESENLINAIKSRTIGFERNIKLKQILETNIPKSIKNYFYLEAEALLNQENYLRIDKDRFDITDDDIKKVLYNLDEVLKQNCIFQRNEFILLLEKAVSFELNYLSKPRWTLTKFIFKDSNSKSVDEIFSLLRYFVDYSYYNDILIGYLNKKNIKKILISDFDKLLKKIDSSLISKYSSYEIATMPKPLLDFINYSNTIKTKNVDITWLMVFYEDKELFGIKSALNLEKDLRGKKNITFEDLSVMIDHLDDIRKPDINKSIDDTLPKKEEVKEKNEQIYNLLNKKSYLKPQLLEKDVFLKDKQDNIILDQQNESYNQIISEDISTERNTETSEINNQNYEDETKLENDRKRVTEIIDNFDYEFTVIGDSNSSEEQNLVTFEINDEDERNFIKKLFNKDEIFYRATMNELSRCKNWKEAAAYIDNLFIKYDINPYSNTAINFTDKIQIGFLKRDVY